MTSARVTALKRRLVLNPADASARFELCDVLAEEHLERGRRDDALLELQTAQALHPDDARLIRIAGLLVRSRLGPAAFRAIERLLRSGRTGPDVLELARALKLGGALLAGPELGALPAGLLAVKVALSQGATAAARRNLALAAAELRATPAFALLKAEVCVQEGRLDKAIDLLPAEAARRLLQCTELIPRGSIGVLGWHPMGGTVSPVQAVAVPGRGELHFTGNVQASGQEAGRLAFACIKARAASFGIAPEALATRDLHLHYTDTELTKDGSSSGLALALAAAAALGDRPLPPSIAATGEITLHGEVRAIAGLHEKLVAAALAEIALVLVPRRNLDAVRELPAQVAARVRIVAVDTLAEATQVAMEAA